MTALRETSFRLEVVAELRRRRNTIDGYAGVAEANPKERARMEAYALALSHAAARLCGDPLPGIDWTDQGWLDPSDRE